LNRKSIAEHAGLTPRLTAQPQHLIRRSTFCVCLLCPFVLPKKPSKSTPAHDAAAVAFLHRHHPIIHVNAGPIQLVYGSPLQLAVEIILDKIWFSPWVSWAFQECPPNPMHNAKIFNGQPFGSWYLTSKQKFLLTILVTRK